jgi:hypothetical protein
MTYTKEEWEQYRDKNREKLNAYSIGYYHRTNRKVYVREWYRKNLLRNREKRRVNNDLRRRQMIQLMGGKCEKCGYSDFRALQVDHKDGYGSMERKSYGHCASTLRKKVIEDMARGRQKYQLLCANCNWIKRAENHEMNWERNGRQKCDL